jgi:hypothetical protein
MPSFDLTVLLWSNRMNAKQSDLNSSSFSQFEFGNKYWSLSFIQVCSMTFLTVRKTAFTIRLSLDILFAFEAFKTLSDGFRVTNTTLLF